MTKQTIQRGRWTTLAVAGVAIVASACAAPRQPAQSAPLSSAAVAQAGWQPLFDGTTLNGFVNSRGEPAQAGGWVAESGVLRRAGRAGDLFTARSYKDFELEWEWKISEAGNSGVKYRMHRRPGGGWLGPEYQVLDDHRHPDAEMGMSGTRKSASLYDVVAAAASKPLRPVGEWNQSRVVARGDHIEHWLNGVKVVDVDLSSPAWRAALSASKFGKEEEVHTWFAREAGPILFQDHNDEVWYRNIRIREFASPAAR